MSVKAWTWAWILFVAFYHTLELLGVKAECWRQNGGRLNRSHALFAPPPLPALFPPMSGEHLHHHLPHTHAQTSCLSMCACRCVRSRMPHLMFVLYAGPSSPPSSCKQLLSCDSEHLRTRSAPLTRFGKQVKSLSFSIPSWEQCEEILSLAFDTPCIFGSWPK